MAKTMQRKQAPERTLENREPTTEWVIHENGERTFRTFVPAKPGRKGEPRGCTIEGRLRVITPELREQIVEIMADALVADILEEQAAVKQAQSTEPDAVRGELDEPVVPETAAGLAARLVSLREARRSRQSERRKVRTARRALTPAQRDAILAKTGRRCHICGGEVGANWQADHVLAHSDGGPHSAENYLPAHALCNNYRWDYSAEEFQWVLKIGVWARKLMESRSRLGTEMRNRFFENEVRRQKRRRSAHNE